MRIFKRSLPETAYKFLSSALVFFMCLIIPAAVFGLTDFVTEDIDEWTVGADTVYWAHNCDLYGAGNCPSGCYLRRQPSHGYSLTLETDPDTETEHFKSLAADDDGLYYYDGEINMIRKYSLLRAGFGPVDIYSPPQPPTTRLVLDETAIYFGASDGIYIAYKNGAWGGKIVNSWDIRDIQINDEGIFYTNPAGLRFIDRCAGWPLCSAVSSWDGDAQMIHVATNGSVYFVGTHPTSGLHTIYERLPGGGIGTYYDLLQSGWLIGHMASDGSNLFWYEYNASEDQLCRRPLSDYSSYADVLDAYSSGIISGLDYRLYTDKWYIYYTFRTQPLKRLDHEAGPAPLAHDFEAVDMEVVQVLQNLDHDVPLTADKETFVRFYGQIYNYPSANGVTASLSGVSSVTGYLGSIEAINGPRYIKANVQPKRENIEDCWLFKLPDSWTAYGTVSLTATIDPMSKFDDPDTLNNSVTREVIFVIRPPACLVFMPVWTHHPGGTPSIKDPNADKMIDVFRMLWPSPDVHVFSKNTPVAEWEWCLYEGVLPYPCNGPYEMPEDKGWIISKIVTLDLFTDDPDSCDDADARTHYVGMVHPETKTTDGDYNYPNGTGNRCLAASWVRFPGHEVLDQYKWNQPYSGFTLAHELSHNYHLYHVDCPAGDPESPNLDYPYDFCAFTFDDHSSPSAHFGFDTRTRSVIESKSSLDPDDWEGDLMSYQNNRWPSDYTYKYLYAGLQYFSVTSCLWTEFCNLPEINLDCWWTIDKSKEVTRAKRELDIAKARYSIARANEIVLISGGIGPSEYEGKLNHAFIYPAAKASSGLIEKWEDRAALPFAEDREASYMIEFLDDMDQIIGEYSVYPREVQNAYEPTDMRAFIASAVVDVSNLAKIRLIADSQEVDILAPGPAIPTLAIISPAGSEIYDVDDPMTISWQASDADPDDILVFTLQYSPDAGSTWTVITTNYPSSPDTDISSMTLYDLDGLKQSPTGLIRILASDGIHTVVETSNPFEIVNRLPVPQITWPPTSIQAVEAGNAFLLKGLAFDSEDGNLSGTQVEWYLDGTLLGTGLHLPVNGLAAGTYTLEFRVTDSNFDQKSVFKTFTVAPRDIQTLTTAPVLDGLCDDDVYENSHSVRLAPYPYGGAQALVKFLKKDTHLYVCFSNMNFDFNYGEDTYATVRIDPDHSRDALAQTDDYLFGADPTNASFTNSGDGLGGFGNSGPGGIRTRTTINSTLMSWSAEMEIDITSLGGWDHVCGIALGQHDIEYSGDDYYWPYDAEPINPSSWSKSVLGDLPWITEVSPENSTAGDTPFSMTVTGSGFVNGAVVRWNGVGLVTTYVDVNTLTAQVTATELATPGQKDITVVNPAVTDAPSNTNIFEVNYRTPVLTALVPNYEYRGTAGTTIVLNGSLFDSAATVTWNGEERTPTFINSQQLQLTISADDLKFARNITVSVANPAPGNPASQNKVFNIIQATIPPTPNGDTVVGTQILTAEKGDPEGFTIFFFWDNTTCPANGYNLVWGNLNEIAGYNPSGCSANIDPDLDGNYYEAMPPFENSWFIVVGTSPANIEGSWGVNSDAIERNTTPVHSSSCAIGKQPIGTCP